MNVSNHWWLLMTRKSPVIDIHQHYLPHQPQWHNEVWQTSLYHESRIQGYADVGRLIAVMDDAAIDQIVWQGEYLCHMEHCVARNSLVLDAMKYNPERLQAFAIVQPDHPNAIDEIARCIDAGMKGVGELNPVAQQFSLRSLNFLRCAEYCARHAIPMLFHVNEPVGPAYPGKVDLPMWAFYELADRYPELTIILAHWGGGLWFYEQMPNVRRVLQNVFYDTAASWFTYPDTHKMMQLAMLVAPHKILFASDFPLKRSLDGPLDLAPWLNEVSDASSVEWRDHIVGRTAHTLLHTMPRHDLFRDSATPQIVDLRTSVVWLVETYPSTDAILQRWSIHVSASTPWWQSIAHAAVSAGHHSQRHAQLLTELRQALSLE